MSDHVCCGCHEAELMQRPMSESEFVLMARRLGEAQDELDLNRRTRDAANKSLREERDEARADAEQAQLRSDAIVRDANKALADMRAEVKRLRADLHTSEASRAGNIERAEFLSGELEKAEAKLERCFSEDHLDTCPYLKTKDKLKAVGEVTGLRAAHHDEAEDSAAAEGAKGKA